MLLLAGGMTVLSTVKNATGTFDAYGQPKETEMNWDRIEGNWKQESGNNQSRNNLSNLREDYYE